MSNALTYTSHKKLLEAWLQAWHRADAEELSSYYCNQLDYRDPNVPEGIKTNALFLRYLRIFFRKWPVQEWIPDEVLAHDRPGAFSVCYRFGFSDRKKEVRGFGMDRIEFEGDKIRLNWVYLNAESWSRLMKS